MSSGLTPALTAFVLGLLVAADSCTLATAITAIGYIAHNIESKRQIFLNGLLYTLGRTLTYLLLSLALIPLLREGANISQVKHLIETYGGLLIGPLFIAIGALMLVSRWVKLPTLPITSRGAFLKNHRGWGALLLGMLFALAICPAIGIIFFGGLLPLAAATPGGLWLPLIFAIGTALPVIVVAWLVAFSIARIGHFYNRMQRLQKWLNIVMAALFILAGIELIHESFHHHHASHQHAHPHHPHHHTALGLHTP